MVVITHIIYTRTSSIDQIRLSMGRPTALTSSALVFLVVGLIDF